MSFIFVADMYKKRNDYPSCAKSLHNLRMSFALGSLQGCQSTHKPIVHICPCLKE